MLNAHVALGRSADPVNLSLGSIQLLHAKQRCSTLLLRGEILPPLPHMKPRSLHFKPSSRSEAFVVDFNQAALDVFLSPTPSKTYVPSFPSIKFFEHQSYEKRGQIIYFGTFFILSLAIKIL